MSNPTEPDRPDETTDEVTGPHEQDEHAPHSQDERTEVLPESEHEPATEVMAPADPNAPPADPNAPPPDPNAPPPPPAPAAVGVPVPIDPATAPEMMPPA